MADRINKLDATGLKILRILQKQARLPFSQVGLQVGLTGPAVAERVRRMEEDGIICGYHAEIEPDAIGLPIRAFIRLRTPPERYSRLYEALEKEPEVIECHHVTGEDAFYLRVAVGSMDRLDKIVNLLSAFGATSTAVILSTPQKVDLPIDQQINIKKK